MREVLYVDEITYEDCGVLGGRAFIRSGTEYEVLENTSPADMLENILFDELRKQQSGKTPYPYTRIAICAAFLNGKVFMAAVDEKTLETDEYIRVEDLAKGKAEFDYSEIGTCLSAWNVQEYAILQELDDGIFREVGYSTPKSKEKYGHAYDVFRCLDLRGICKAPVVESREDFHNYVRYALGEDYFIEALDNEVTGTREFWLCRDFGFAKFQITAYDQDDLHFRGLFDNSGNLIIDEQIAETLWSLSDPHEFLFVDNDYNLSMHALEMDGDDELFAQYGL